MSLLKTLHFILNHPLNVNNRFKAFSRFISWQIGCRLLPGPVSVNFVNNSRLLVKRGMTGATGNIYAGLHEFEDMAFVLHCLRKSDTFIDVGANIGSYTVLAGSVIQAKCISIEPSPVTFNCLIDNINLNRIQENVLALNICAGRENGTLKFTSSLDTQNHVLTDRDDNLDVINVSVKKLDDIAGKMNPTMIKIDVEGFETDVMAGAKNILCNDSLIAVLMELNGSGKRYGYDESALHNLMLDYGFKTFSYFPMKRELSPLGGKNPESGNTLYIKDAGKILKRLKTAPFFEVNGHKI